jgi:hypothetical protein
MPDTNPRKNLQPKQDPFDAPDVQDEADTRVLEGGGDAGDGDAEDVRRELGLQEDGDFL